MKLLFSCNTGVYAKGGKTKKEEGVDLFIDNDGNDIPQKVQRILDKYENAFIDGDYDELTKAHDELYKIGYTFESGLDGQAYDLRKIGQKGKISGYAKGGKLHEKWNNKSAKYKVGDKVYSYQNKSYLAPISYVKFVPYLSMSEPNAKDSYKYKLKLKDGYSNWINEEGLLKIKTK